MEKALAPYSSTLAWRIPGTEEPGGLQSMRSPRAYMTERLLSLSQHLSKALFGQFQTFVRTEMRSNRFLVML